MTRQHLKDLVIRFRCVMLRYNPIRHPVGLLKSGDPTPDSPVLVSGNYYHTVRRLQRAVAGLDCHILVADSAGINVWCASGVCDFNEHKIADAVNSTELGRVVRHRVLVLPQLAAVGVDLASLRSECGFTGVWGPASLDDLPVFIGAGSKATRAMRLIRFPLIDRFYNAVGMFNVFLIIPIGCLLLRKWSEAHFFLLMNAINIFGIFIFHDILPFKYPASNSLLIGLVTLAGVLLDTLYRPVAGGILLFRLAGATFVNFLVSIDMLGSTPFYKTTLFHWLSSGNLKSLFQPEVLTHCTCCGSCEEICPKGLFSIGLEKAAVDLEKECCECLACVKQCPVTAIVNLNGAIFKDDIKSLPNLSLVTRQRPTARSDNGVRRTDLGN